MDDMKQAHALPFWGKGEAPPTTERVKEPDERGFCSPNLSVGLVALGCVCIWVLQYRIDGGRLRLRVRLGSHLVSSAQSRRAMRSVPARIHVFNIGDYR